jgi:hypothetical protein
MTDYLQKLTERESEHKHHGSNQHGTSDRQIGTSPGQQGSSASTAGVTR